MTRISKALFVGTLMCLTALYLKLPILASGTESKYLSLTSDMNVVSNSPVFTNVLETTISLPRAQWVYVQSDGGIEPSGTSLAWLEIYIDQVRISNSSTIDWRGSSNAVAHSFNCIGAKYLSAGSHTIQLQASKKGSGTYKIKAKSNLSIMTDPAPTVLVSSLSSDAGPYNFNTTSQNCLNSHPNLSVLAQNVGLTSPQVIISLASGRSYKTTASGDAMWGIFHNGTYPGNNAASWSVNDLFEGAELQAPMYNHAYVSGVTGNNSMTLRASEYPWIDQNTQNTVVYKIGATTKLISLTGMQVKGKGTAGGHNCTYYFTDWKAVGTGPEGTVSECSQFPECSPTEPRTCGTTDRPCTGTDVLLASGTISIPAGHSGVVMIVAKTHLQGDSCDNGSTARLKIKLDGSWVGSEGLQQTKCPNGESQRIMGASYLATGLSQGNHSVQVYGRIDLASTDSVRHISMTRYLPLIWFD